MGGGDQEEGRQDRHHEAGQDQGPGGQGGGEEHTGETRRRLLRSWEENILARIYRPARKAEK